MPMRRKPTRLPLSIASDYAPALQRPVRTFSPNRGRRSRRGTRIDRQIAAQPRGLPVVCRKKPKACIAQKEWTCAEHTYQQVLGLNPYYVNAYLALAHIYAATNRPAKT